jgi:hypothetical protein
MELLFRRGGERRMCHSLKWENWELLEEEERRETVEPRVEESSEPEPLELEPERDPERELVRA